MRVDISLLALGFLASLLPNGCFAVPVDGDVCAFFTKGRFCKLNPKCKWIRATKECIAKDLTPPNPYLFLDTPAKFSLTSHTFSEGGELPPPQRSAIFGIPGGEDESPQLSWTGFHPDTKSFTLTCFDPDAPTVSGFWHWVVYDIPATVTSIGAGANLTAGAKFLQNDGRCVGPIVNETGFVFTPGCNNGYIGAAPPAGDGPHRYIFVVTAMNITSFDDVGFPGEGASPAVLQFFTFNVGNLGRGFLTGTFEVPPS